MKIKISFLAFLWLGCLVKSEPVLIPSLVKSSSHCEEIDVLIYNGGRWFVDVPSYIGPVKYGVDFRSDCSECMVARGVDVTPLARGDTLRLYPKMFYGYRVDMMRYYRFSSGKFKLWAVVSLKNMGRGNDVIQLATDTIDCVGK